MTATMTSTYSLRYRSAGGQWWPLAAPGDTTGVMLRRGGISGLVGEVDEEALTAVGVPGQVVDAQDILPLKGSLSVDVFPDGQRTAGEVLSGWRSAWSRSPRLAGLLEINSPTLGWVDESLSTVTAEVRLAEAMPPLEEDPAGLPMIDEQECAVVGDGGVWWGSELSGTGTVTISNPGDVRVWPVLEWLGAGGRVVAPSGARFTLPAVSQARRVVLDDAQSRVVTDRLGVLDRPLWHELASVVLPEGIPPGASRTWVLPAGVSVRWRLGVLDPWR